MITSATTGRTTTSREAELAVHESSTLYLTSNDDSMSEENEDRTISMEEAWHRVGTGRFQRRIGLAAGLCFAADAMEILLLSFLSVVLQERWELSDAQFSTIFATIFGGAFLGTLTLGRLADRHGRRPILVVTAATIAVFGLATALVQTYPQLLVCRFSVGFGVGGITVPFDTLAEITTTDRRGPRLVSTSYYWTTATLLVPILAWMTLPTGNWRLFVALCATPCVVSAIVAVYVVPESPRWLLQRGDVQGALTILRQAALANGHDPALAFPSQTQLIPESPTGNATFWDLLSPRWCKTTLTLWCLWGSYAFLYYGTVLAVTLAFFKPGHPSDNQNYKSYNFDYLPIVLSSSAEVAGVTLVLWTVDRFGRIPCLSLYFLAGGLAVLALGWLERDTSSLKIVLAFVARLLVYSGSNIVWILTAELLPTEIRTTGHSAANAVARVGAFLAPFWVRPTEDPKLVGFLMVLVSLIAVGCAQNLPETRGRPLGVMMQQPTSTFHTMVPLEDFS